jgi:putative tryptophan/tyrosine transport system substrate-binding protein
MTHLSLYDAVLSREPVMKRRTFIKWLGSGVGLAAVGPTRGQRTILPVIGFLHSESPSLLTKPLEYFRLGLAESGYRESQNVAIEYRWAEGRNEVLSTLATDLVRRNVKVIVTPGTTPASLAAKAATSTIPIVFFTAGDPVSLGLVKSLNQPGGNATGVTSLGSELLTKRLALMHELLPDVRVMCLLANQSNAALRKPVDEAIRVAASLGVQLYVVSGSSEADFLGVFSEVERLRAGALIIAIDSFFTSRRELLGAMALNHGVPAVYQYADFAEAGGIISYGGSLSEPYTLVGNYAGRVLNGESPATLPVQQATTIELVVNLKVAKRLGITVPLALLGRADKVIE